MSVAFFDYVEMALGAILALRAARAGLPANGEVDWPPAALCVAWDSTLFAPGVLQ
jgi:hypothetical protein